MTRSLSLRQRKALGAYYTDESVARFLVAWALPEPGSAVMDPSCGDGRFLDLATERGASRLVGCDISPDALAASRERLAGSSAPVELACADFFAVEPGAFAAVDAVVGNPPFIRYQRFDQHSRRRALASALRIGVRLTRLTSSWAPFLLHATQFLEPGGRLAMVVPAEIVQTQYGLQTLRGLLARFAAVSLVAFDENFFEDAQEGTCLLLAEGHGAACRHVRLIPFGTVADVLRLAPTDLAASAAVEVPLERGSLARFAEAYLDRDERSAWSKIKRHPDVRTVAALASVTNGYVTGDNEFFHRCRKAAQNEGYPATWLFPVARSSRSLRGLEFTLDDVAELEERGPAHHLLVPQDDLFLAADRPQLERWIAEGEKRGTPARFKCRSRDPWWRVPGLQRADVLVGYMAGRTPRASVNRASGYFTNSLHGLRLREGGSAVTTKLALALYSTLSLLSLEIEGRSYGGGILKVEPRELDRVLVPWPELAPNRLEALADLVDRHLRAGRFGQASQAVDEVFLGQGLGASGRSLAALRGARRRLVERRTGRRRARTG